MASVRPALAAPQRVAAVGVHASALSAARGAVLDALSVLGEEVVSEKHGVTPLRLGSHPRLDSLEMVPRRGQELGGDGRGI